MECITASVKKIVNNSTLADEQLNALLNRIKLKEAENKAAFFSEIETNLSHAKIGDINELISNSSIITEYLSEFSLDQIKTVVASELEKAKSRNDINIDPLMTAEAIESFTTLVNLIKETAKSSSANTNIVQYSMHRVSPGNLVFLYALSQTIQDDETFGQEPVTATVIYYKLIFSIDDVKHQAVFDNYQIDKEAYIKMKKLQANLLDKLTDGSIDFDTWTKMDDKFSLAVDKAKARLDADQLDL